MFSALIAETDAVVPEGVLLALSPEFHMQIQWLPGGRIVNGEPLFDEVFEEDPCRPTIRADSMSDDNAREFLYNLVAVLRGPGICEYRPGSQLAVAAARAPRAARRVHRGDQAAQPPAGDREHHPHAEVGCPRASARRPDVAVRHVQVRRVHGVRSRPPIRLPSPGDEHPQAHHDPEGLRTVRRLPRPRQRGR